MAKSRTKALKPTWEGHLKLSLVTCPVALYTAIEHAADVHFNLINPKTGNRIRMQSVDAGSGHVVERSELVRGFAVAKNKYVLFDKDELDAVKLESTRIIDIESFVDAAGIDRIYWDEPYYLAPAGKTGIEAFAVIRAALEEQSKVALGRLVLHQRERLCALEPRGDGIVLTTLRSHDDVRDSRDVFDLDLPKPTRQMLEIAEKIVAQQNAKFDPMKFKDRYEDALRDLIARKKKGETLVSSASAAKDDKVIDLMQALKQSLESHGSISRDKARRLAAGSRRPRASSAKRRSSSRAA
ncbi:MAG: Ku protein [Reyranellaceae bacterium]